MTTGETIGETLHRAAALIQPFAGDDARLESELLLAHALDCGRAQVIARLRDALTDGDADAFDALVARRLRREPLALIVGHREFYGIELAVTHAVLIPRPETEMLVERALIEIRSRGGNAAVADVGTGSGAIAIAIATHAPDAMIIATDTSLAALKVARANAVDAAVGERIEFRQANLLDATPPVDVIVANLPYVTEHDWDALPPEIRDHEPRAALVGGVAGTEVIERLLDAAPRHLRAGGVVLAEMGAEQGDVLSAVARRCFPDGEVCVIKDFGGLDRLLFVRMVGG